jgi:hypothetical protein
VPADIDFSDRDQLELWLSNKPREVAVVFAARAALRVAPLLVSELGPLGSTIAVVSRDLVLPVLRAMATPWIAGQHPTQNASAVHAAAVARAAAATSGANASTAVANAAYSAADAAITADTAAAATAAADYAARADAAARAATADAARADAKIIDLQAGVSALAARPLWLTKVPARTSDAWQRLEQALLKENHDWRVWTEWYRARLDGGPASEPLEVARVLIADEFWKAGPRAVNGEIARLIAQYKPPKPLADVPSAFAFAWTAAGTMTIASSPANWPVFPLPASEKDHRDRLETCRILARDMISELKAQKYQVRGEYADGLAKYRSRLPTEPGHGNILLADAAARTLRSLFAAEAYELPCCGFEDIPRTPHRSSRVLSGNREVLS